MLEKQVTTTLNISSLLKIMTDRIIEQFNPQSIIVFGSYARGEATVNSDIDLLIIFSEVNSKRQMAISIRQALADLPIAKDIVVTTTQEISRYGQLVGTVLRPALREGKLLYERE
jgi:predicted nucleotidyltransferase